MKLFPIKILYVSFFLCVCIFVLINVVHNHTPQRANQEATTERKAGEPKGTQAEKTGARQKGNRTGTKTEQGEQEAKANKEPTEETTTGAEPTPRRTEATRRTEEQGTTQREEPATTTQREPQRGEQKAPPREPQRTEPRTIQTAFITENLLKK